MTDHTFTNVTIAEGAKLHHATRGKAERLDAMLKSEYPRITVDAATNEDNSKVTGWSASYADPDEGAIDLYEGNKLPDLTDLLEACQAQDLDPEAGSEETPRGGSVVDATYRNLYKEASTTGQSCGDWLAETLTTMTHTAEGIINIEDFTAILSANGVDLTAKWAQIDRNSRGWIGRYRMNGRQVLEKRVAFDQRLLNAQGAEIEVPTFVIDELRSKHAKWIAKEEKRLAREAEKEQA